MPKFAIADIIDLVVSAVTGVQEMFPDKPGPEKKKIVTTDVIKGLSLTPEQIARSAALVSEAIEVGVQIMKLQSRIRAIAKEVQAIRALSTKE